MPNSREYNKAYYLQHSDRIKQQRRDAYRAYQRQYMQAYRAAMSPEDREAFLAKRRSQAKVRRLADPSVHRKQQLRAWLRRWGYPESELRELADVLWDRKHGPCDICEVLPTRQLHHVDHDHVTGLVRGVLCSRCNSAIGLFGDDPALITQALAYLRNQT